MYRQGSLSDYSDYESSDEETHNRASGSGSGMRAYQNVEGHQVEDDPFADPFVDQEDEGVSTPGIHERKLVW
jgi:LAS seventeen-binding protein 5